MITSIAFTVYPVTDMARSRGFYEGVLGLTISENYRDEWVEYDLGGFHIRYHNHRHGT